MYKMIELSFKKNSQNKYDLKVVQNGKLFFKRTYDSGKKIDDPIWKTQADGFSAFVRFLQDKVDKEFEKNPNFHWKTISEFKLFAGARAQHEFFEHEQEYVPDSYNKE